MAFKGTPRSPPTISRFCPKYQALDRPDTALLCAIYEALARIWSAPSSSPAKAEELCLRVITTLDRPTGGGGAITRGAGAGAAATKGMAMRKGMHMLRNTAVSHTC